jgi:hypothetical protein
MQSGGIACTYQVFADRNELCACNASGLLRETQMQSDSICDAWRTVRVEMSAPALCTQALLIVGISEKASSRAASSVTPSGSSFMLAVVRSG